MPVVYFYYLIFTILKKKKNLGRTMCEKKNLNKENKIKKKIIFEKKKHSGAACVNVNIEKIQ